MRISNCQPLRIQDRAPSQLVRAAWALTGALLIGSIASAQSNQPGQRPSFDVVTKALTDYFASLKDYKAGDLVSQSHVARALERVTDATGWEVPNREAIVKLALADNSFLVAQLSTPGGRQFMRSIAKYSGTYSRLDRLSTISGGQQFIKDVMRKPGGSDIIQYMATTPGGHNLGTMMAGVKQGVDLNKPTGRIYTADDLLAQLKRAYGKATP